MENPKPMSALWYSRKFRLLLLDTIIALITVFATWYLAPDAVEKVLTIIGILQAPVIMVIGGIAYEDAAEKSNATYYAEESPPEAKG